MGQIDQNLYAVIPTYNAERTLERCLDGLALSTVIPHEIIIVDDASADGTVALARRRGCKTLEMPVNAGPGKARNSGAAKAGESLYLAFIDSDVVVGPDTLEILLRDVREAGYAAASAVQAPQTPGLGFFGSYKNHYTCHKWRLLHGKTTILNCSAAIVRRSAFEEIGGINEAMRIGEDADLGTRLAQKYTICLDASAEVAHLRPYTFISLVKDTFNKGRLLACYAARRHAGAHKADGERLQMLSFPYVEIAGFFLGPAVLVCLLAGLWTPLAVLAAAFWLLRASFILYLARQGGIFYAIGCMFYMVVESSICMAALLAAVPEILKSALRPAPSGDGAGS